jgi:hypothetical protein
MVWLKYWTLLILIQIAGCQVFTPPDPVATLQADNNAIIAEATAIARAVDIDRRDVQATAMAAMTEVADLQTGNLELLATVRAGDPPQARVVAQTNSALAAQTPGQRWFTKTGVALQINQADGCVVAPQITFPAGVEKIYSTMHALNVEAGLQLSAAWSYEGTEVHQESFTLDRDWSEVCLWFFIDSATVDLLPGHWSVQMYADGVGLESPTAFTIGSDEANMEG